MSKTNPTLERVDVNLAALPHTTNNPYRGFVADADGLVTLRLSSTEAAPVQIVAIRGFNPHTFDSITAVSGITKITAYR